MNLPEIKLLCTDIDGTLLNAQRGLSNRTMTAFAKAGLPIILASSRPPQGMRYLQEDLSISNDPLIAYNGGLIIGKKGAIVSDHSFPTKVLGDLIQHHDTHTYNLSIYSHHHWFTDREDIWTQREINNTRTQPTYQPATESLKFLEKHHLGIHKLMCMGVPEELDALSTYLAVSYDTTVHLYRSKDSYLEITPKHTDKAQALKELLKKEYDFGIEKVMAFGDNHNDVELLLHSGFGVAVYNSTQSIKTIANHVSPYTNKEDAVAIAIERFLL